jgi:hypothetical protein
VTKGQFVTGGVASYKLGARHPGIPAEIIGVRPGPWPSITQKLIAGS